MNDLNIFENAEFGQVRTVAIDNEPWFCGKDVAVALGYKDTKNAL
ncbi:BRO family protein, partial [Lachnospiraceae bacterium 46-15]